VNHFSTFFSSKAIIAYFSVLMICAWLFVPMFLPFIWIAFGTFSVFSFFYFSSVISKRWANINPRIFQKKIFLTSLLIRSIYVVLIYIFYMSKNGNPFEFNSGDSGGYHNEAEYIVKLFESNKMGFYFKEYLQGFSDAGWPIILSIIYLFSFNSILVARFVNALVSAYMVILIYKISRRNFGEESARISAIMTMLLPAFIYYSGLHLKETMMIFLLVFFIERSDFLIHSGKYELINIIQTIFLGISLFFFRTVMATAAWFALFSAVVFSTKQLMTNYRKIVIISWFLVGTAFILTGRIKSEVTEYIDMRNQNQSNRMEFFSTREGANQLAKYGSSAVFIPIILIAPFPTLVNIPEQQNQMMINGDLFTRNIYVFFVIIAFYIIFRSKRIRETMLLSVFLVTYLLILANSGFALSPRFHVPALPFFMIFAGFGISKTNRTFSSYYFLYIIGISLVVIAWNWFKLAGRGLI